MKHRRLVLIGDENSGIASLSKLLREVGNGNVRVESLVGNEIRNATERISKKNTRSDRQWRVHWRTYRIISHENREENTRQEYNH